MKINKKALELIEKGLTSKTVSKLTESQIDVLHSKLIGEQVTQVPAKPAYKVGPKGGNLPPNPKGYSLRQDPNTKEVVATASESEMKETETDDITDKNALGADSLQNITGQDAPHDANDMAPDGMDDDSDDDRNAMGMTEGQESNPWAICTAQLGKEFKTRDRSQWSPKQKSKYERCVKDVKNSLKEGKNPVSLFLENEIMKIVERNLPPRITKGDLVKYITENGPAVAPTKPKPTVKPGKPETRPRPSHPGKNPNPGVNPAPKAISPDKAKDKVIDLIINLLEK
jgi:hypothetical protein